MSIQQLFRQQAEDCANMGSPFMARLMSGLADGLRPGSLVTDNILGLQGAATTRAYALPLRLAGGLHALALTARDPDLAEAYDDPQSDPTKAASRPSPATRPFSPPGSPPRPRPTRSAAPPP